MTNHTENMTNIPEIAGRNVIEALFDHAAEGLLFADASGMILKSNRTADKMFGYEKNELKGRKFISLITRHVTDAERFCTSLSSRADFISNIENADLGLCGLKKDGSEFPAELTLDRIIDGGTVLTLVKIRDLTVLRKCEFVIHQQKEEIKRLNAEVKMLNAEMETRVRKRTHLLEAAMTEIDFQRDQLKINLEKEHELNEMKSRFVSMASHEFRTPLATILSSLNLSSRYAEQGDFHGQNKHLTRIRSAVTHMTELMNDVLSVSKLEEGIIAVSPEVFDFEDFIGQLLQDLKPLLKDGQVLLYIHRGEKLVFLDKKILKNLLFNLVSNAIKFSPEGKTISVKSDIVEKDILMCVKDEGIGIPEEDKKHLFHRFFRAHNAGNIQGTGLGLYITVKYVELLHGNISYESRQDEGTEFSIRIPNRKAE
jgi:PAS domain S-box-containing protein